MKVDIIFMKTELASLPIPSLVKHNIAINLLDN